MNHRSIFTTLLACVALALGAAACSKPKDDDCKSAIANIRHLYGTANSAQGMSPQAAVRSCRGSASRESVDCIIKAKTLQEARVLRGRRRVPRSHEGRGGDEAAADASSDADSGAAPASSGAAGSGAKPGTAPASPGAASSGAAAGPGAATRSGAATTGPGAGSGTAPAEPGGAAAGPGREPGPACSAWPAAARALSALRATAHPVL